MLLRATVWTEVFAQTFSYISSRYLPVAESRIQKNANVFRKKQNTDDSIDFAQLICLLSLGKIQIQSLTFVGLFSVFLVDDVDITI